MTDTNDNAPIFEQPVYNIERLETVRAGASLGQFVATDKDTRSNGEIRYILESGNEEGETNILKFCSSIIGIFKWSVSRNYIQIMRYTDLKKHVLTRSDVTVLLCVCMDI